MDDIWLISFSIPKAHTAQGRDYTAFPRIHIRNDSIPANLARNSEVSFSSETFPTVSQSNSRE
jgi:hypothetical protein